MKSTYKKKPEYLECIDVLDDTRSIKDLFEMAGKDNCSVSFNENGDRVVTIDGLDIITGMVVFKDKKTDKLIAMPKEKLLQFYDECNCEGGVVNNE